MSTNVVLGQYEEFIYKSRYARWIEEESRREDWPETITRYLNFVAPPHLVDTSTWEMLFNAILHCEIMPSMRAMMSAGPAAERCNVAVYNCAYTPIERDIRFSEALYILMCGTGLGFSVERRYAGQLPDVPHELRPMHGKFVVEDSKKGWATCLRTLVDRLYMGYIPQFDYSLIRPEGARLKTMGGRASGPGPLIRLVNFVTETFDAARGRKLRPIEVFDILCMTGDVVVVGGVRRSALIALFDHDDIEMRNAKSGDWRTYAPWRELANISAVYESKPSQVEFLTAWSDLQRSYSGEPGIFNRGACRDIASLYGRPPHVEYGTNPCSEIILRPYQFCNLSEIVRRSTDTFNDVLRKAKVAAILGTLQARFVDFDFLSPEWRKTTAEDALLGVSMTGIYDCEDLTDDQLMQARCYVSDINAEWAFKLGINRAAANTCVKPSGTVSQRVNSASGIHARHSEFYIRRVRGDAKDPLSAFLMASGVPWEWAIGKQDKIVVFSFPQRAPKGCKRRDELGAVEHLQAWLKYQTHWCEHKPSITVYIRDDEWIDVMNFVYKHFDLMSGVAFLPYDGGTYPQAPYEEIDEATFLRLEGEMPVIDWHQLSLFEREDSTSGGQTFACTGGVCEIVDIGSA